MEKKKNSKDVLEGIPIAEVIASAQAGNSSAIELLLRHFKSDIRSYAQSVCSTPEDAEDATQNALLAISRKIPIFRKTIRFSSWAFSIVKHECYRFFKKGKRFVGLDDTEHSNDENALDSVAHEELIALVQQSIAQLEPQYRQILLMRDVEQLALSEVAETLNISLSATKSRLHRAREQVKKDLQNTIKHDRTI